MPNRTARLVLALAVFAVVGVIFLGPVSTVTDAHTGTQSVTNETVTADYNSTVDLSGYDVDSGSETVWAENSSGVYKQATSPDDYTLNEGPGSLDFNSSSTLVQDGEQVKVSYNYEAAGPVASLVIGFAPMGVALVVFAMIGTRVSRMV